MINSVAPARRENHGQSIQFYRPRQRHAEGQEVLRSIFGWKLTPTGMQYDYHVAVTADSDEKNKPKEAGAINGALYDRAGGDDAIRLSINVESMDEALKGVRENGGKVWMTRWKLPDMDSSRRSWIPRNTGTSGKTRANK